MTQYLLQVVVPLDRDPKGGQVAFTVHPKCVLAQVNFPSGASKFFLLNPAWGALDGAASRAFVQRYGGGRQALCILLRKQGRRGLFWRVLNVLRPTWWPSLTGSGERPLYLTGSDLLSSRTELTFC